MNKRRRIETPPLPEAMIHHIQSFLSRKEAARSSLLSKSWFNAWRTRPTIDLDFRDLNNSYYGFWKYAANIIKRYRDLRLKIECFRLRLPTSCYRPPPFGHNLVVSAVEFGATDVQLEFSLDNYFTVPQELLASQTLLKLSLRGCRVDLITASTLKSLTLNNVELASGDVFDNIISCNAASIEELFLCRAFGLSLSRMNAYELRKLRRLSLSAVDVGSVFTSGFASRFPCLNDLSISKCGGCEKIHIFSTSLQTISFEPVSRSWKSARFDVPNIRKFIYSGSSSPYKHLSIKAAASREWEFDVSISCKQLHKRSWFLNLKKYLSKFRLSRMSLSIKLSGSFRHSRTRCVELEVDIEVVAEPLVVENLMIETPYFYCCALLVRLFGICRPKFITLYRHKRSWDSSDGSIDLLCKRLMQQESITPDCNCGIPDLNMFGQFGLKRVKMEVYEMIDDTEWMPLVVSKPPHAYRSFEKQQKIQFQLTWEDSSVSILALDKSNCFALFDV